MNMRNEKKVLYTTSIIKWFSILILALVGGIWFSCPNNPNANKMIFEDRREKVRLVEARTTEVLQASVHRS
jgi:hypothetical protein